MARAARIMVPNCPCHITHRGNHRREIFARDVDRRTYLHDLRSYADRFGMRVWAYCLMPNHVHIVAVGRERASISKAIGNAHRRFSRRQNATRNVTGHLWANRFYSTLLDEPHLWAAVRYVELNPVRAGFAAEATEYAWSSARANAKLFRESLLDPERPFPGPVSDWQAWLRTGLEEQTGRRLRTNTFTGWPTGSDEFILGLEQRLGRAIRKNVRRRIAE